MKVRRGFVSNSSTSSFVILGFTVPAGTISDEKYMEVMGLKMPEDPDDIDCSLREGKDGVCVLQDGEDGAPYGKHIVGVRLADWSNEDSVDHIEVSIADTLPKLHKIGCALGVPYAATIFIGTRCS